MRTPLRALEADLVEQRVGDRLLRGLHRAVLAGALAGAHHRLAHLVHHRADVGEVEVDDAGADHQVGDALDALVEHVVGEREGLGEGGLLVGQPEQVLVRDDDQGVDVALQLLDALLGLLHPARALELEGLGDDADGQDAHLAGGLGDDRRGTGAGAAAHAGGDEAHVAAGEALDDLLDQLLGRGGADLGAGAGAEALGDAGAELELVAGLALLQRLGVGVGDDELAALERFSIMLLTALPPAPPTPITVIRGLRSWVTGMLSVSAICCYRLLWSPLPPRPRADLSSLIR